MRFATLLPVLLPLAVLGAACSATNNQPQGSGGGGTGAGGSASTGVTQTLTITPADAVLELVDGQPASLDYHAALVAPGSQTDVTASATFTVDDTSLGDFQGAKFTAKGLPGKLNVHAAAEGLSASTTLTLKASTIVITPGAPADAPSKFGGTVDPSQAPSIVYPADGVLVPPNMNVLEMHFMKGGSNGSGNHIAQWVLHVERKPCTQTSDCDPGEACANGTCEPIPK